MTVGNRFRQALSLGLAIVSLGCAGSSKPDAQAPPVIPEPVAPAPPVTPPAMPPLPPLIFEYELWDHHFIQWLREDLPYETAELLVKETSPQPTLWFFLTKREAVGGSKAQEHWVNERALSDALSASGGERQVSVADINYDYVESATGTHLRMSLSTPHGPVQWSFDSQGQPSPAHGARLINNLEAAHDLEGGLLAFYLESSAVAAKSSVLVLGGVRSEALDWPEISHPPHFIAYRGSHSRRAHVAYFPALAPMQVDTTRHPEGDPRVWLQQRKVGTTTNLFKTALNVTGEDWRFTTGRFQQHAAKTQNGFVTTALSSNSAGGSAVIEFSPPVEDLATISGSAQSAWKLNMAGQEAIMSGTLTVQEGPDGLAVRLHPESPAWAKQLSLNANVKITDTGFTYESRMVFPSVRAVNTD